MRALSQRQAHTCEHAITPASRCKCRCGGQFHGSARGKDESFFEALEIEDPHHVPEKKQRRGAAIRRVA